MERPISSIQQQKKPLGKKKKKNYFVLSFLKYKLQFKL